MNSCFMTERSVKIECFGPGMREIGERIARIKVRHIPMKRAATEQSGQNCSSMMGPKIREQRVCQISWFEEDLYAHCAAIYLQSISSCTPNSGKGKTWRLLG